MALGRVGGGAGVGRGQVTLSLVDLCGERRKVEGDVARMQGVGRWGKLGMRVVWDRACRGFLLGEWIGGGGFRGAGTGRTRRTLKPSFEGGSWGVERACEREGKVSRGWDGHVPYSVEGLV